VKLTIGMPSYNNFPEVFFTVQALRMYHDLKDCEILVIDNYGKDPELEKFIKNQGCGQVRYEKFTETPGPAGAKNAVFEHAKGDMVICMDSHIMLMPGALNNITMTDDLIQGPMVYNDLVNFCYEWEPVWRGNMWGVWGRCVNKEQLPKKPVEIWGLGMGLFMASRQSWLGFNKNFKGFGGEEGYIHEKYRKAGRKVICYPNMIWMHMFDRKIPYPLNLIDRVRNYVIGFEELGLDLAPVIKEFGVALVAEARTKINTTSKVSIPMIPKIETKPPVVNVPIKSSSVSTLPAVSCLCVTYGRPAVLLEESIQSFLRQNYMGKKELIVLNDYSDQTLVFDHPDVVIINMPRRFKSLGEKRNASVALSSHDILCVWDDDDIYLPNRLSLSVQKLSEQKPYYNPKTAFIMNSGVLSGPDTQLYPGGYCWYRSLFDKVRGYAHMNTGEDADLEHHFWETNNSYTTAPTILPTEIFYIYRWAGTKSFHMSGHGWDKNGEKSGYEKVREGVEDQKRRGEIQTGVIKLNPHWETDYCRMVSEHLQKQK
jgi:glycosyltransferase involved in cell wall biosynthesis